MNCSLRTAAIRRHRWRIADGLGRRRDVRSVTASVASRHSTAAGEAGQTRRAAHEVAVRLGPAAQSRLPACEGADS